MGLTQGRRSDLVPKENQVSKPTLADAGIDKKLSARAQKTRPLLTGLRRYAEPPGESTGTLNGRWAPQRTNASVAAKCKNARLFIRGRGVCVPLVREKPSACDEGGRLIRRWQGAHARPSYRHHLKTKTRDTLPTTSIVLIRRAKLRCSWESASFRPEVCLGVSGRRAKTHAAEFQLGSATNTSQLKPAALARRPHDLQHASHGALVEVSFVESSSFSSDHP